MPEAHSFSIRPSFIRIDKNYSNKNSSRTLQRGSRYHVMGIETGGDETEEQDHHRQTPEGLHACVASYLIFQVVRQRFHTR